jgi:hypothetical protein
MLSAGGDTGDGIVRGEREMRVKGASREKVTPRRRGNLRTTANGAPFRHDVRTVIPAGRRLSRRWKTRRGAGEIVEKRKTYSRTYSHYESRLIDSASRANESLVRFGTELLEIFWKLLLRSGISSSLGI